VGEPEDRRKARGHVVDDDHDARPATASLPEEAARFLARYPPFNTLPRKEVRHIAEAVVQRHVQPGEVVLVQNGPPARYFFVIRDGSLDLVNNETVVDVMASGETFGHATLLTEHAPAFTVRAREEAILYLIPRAVALELLGTPAGVTYIADTLSDRRVRTMRAFVGTPQVRTVPVASLIRRPPVFCDLDTSVREAARLMSQEVVTALLVRARGGLGIVTDADLRDKVLAPGLSPETPVSAIMTRPVRTIGADSLATEASIEMMASGVNHLVVVGPGGAVLGVISAGSLMTPDALSPFALRWSISTAGDKEELVAVAARLPELFVALFAAHLEARDISRVLSLQQDAISTRLLELSERRHGPPPLPYAWLTLGSAARGELTLASDQENALAYADSDDPEVDAYFARLAQEVNAGLVACGFVPDESEVMARNRTWRLSQSAWQAVFGDCLEHPGRSNLVRAAIAFDFRQLAGDLDVVPALVALLREAPAHPGFLARLARTATDVRSPLVGLRQRLVGPLDIKKSAALPITNLARFHALANGVTVPATLDRLLAVEELAALDAETATALQEAFTIVSHVRLEHHAVAIREGKRPHNAVDPNTLTPLARLDLQAALRVVVAAQKQLSHYVPLGM
jgi:CBS domain-containing protein